MKFLKCLVCVTIFLIVLILFSSCATMQTINVSHRTREFNANYLSTFKAIVDYCNEKNFAIIMVDKDLGIINTDFKENDGVSKILVGNYRFKINFSIRKISETETQVILIASTEKQGFFGSWTQTTMLEGDAVEYYNKIFSGIQVQLNKYLSEMFIIKNFYIFAGIITRTF